MKTKSPSYDKITPIMSGDTTACIFPAFGTEYLGTEREIIHGLSYDLDLLFEMGAAAAGLDRSLIDLYPDGSFPDELQSQYIAYLYSCAVSDIVKKKIRRLNCCAGYSMGLYAALYHTGAVSFEEGLALIKKAYECIQKDASGYDLTMGVIAGLTYDDLASVIAGNAPAVEIINVNNRHNMIIAGTRVDVEKTVGAARQEGALNAKILQMKVAYHSRRMDAAARALREHLGIHTPKAPDHPLISTIDQRIMRTSDDLVNDLVSNINTPINWMKTMEAMIRNGVTLFLECGPGRSLERMGKFIDGDFKIITLAKLENAVRLNR
jgi:[acyl-carrier-protein] S-malonyltransferase